MCIFDGPLPSLHNFFRPKKYGRNMAARVADLDPLAIALAESLPVLLACFLPIGNGLSFVVRLRGRCCCRQGQWQSLDVLVGRPQHPRGRASNAALTPYVLYAVQKSWFPFGRCLGAFQSQMKSKYENCTVYGRRIGHRKSTKGLGIQWEYARPQTCSSSHPKCFLVPLRGQDRRKHEEKFGARLSGQHHHIIPYKGGKFAFFVRFRANFSRWFYGEERVWSEVVFSRKC